MVSSSTQHLDSPKVSTWNVTNSLRRLVETASDLVDGLVTLPESLAVQTPLD
jgi:hypothetical protein